MANATVDDQFDLFGGFVAEIEGYVPSIAANMQRLLADPADEALLEECHRFAHTIKSSAGMMGMPELRKLAAPMESLLAKAYAGDVMITPAVVDAVQGTLGRVQRFLGGQSGGSAAGLIADNDQVYAGLRTSARDRAGEPTADAADRLAHLDDGTAGELALLLASGVPVADTLPLQVIEPTSTATVAPSDLGAADHETDAEDLAETAPTAASITLDALNGAQGTPAERPQLTLLSNWQPEATDASAADGGSVAAEWLAELLSTESAAARRAAAPAEPAASAIPAVDPTLDQAWQTREQAWQEREQEWARHLVTERARYEAQIESERCQSELRAQQLLSLQERFAQQAAVERDQALETQRLELEAQVQRFIENELRPQIEEEVREELTHEFQVAALLDPTDAPPRRKAPVGRSSLAQDEALAAEMRVIFAQEAEEHIQAIGEYTVALKAHQEDAERLSALRRSVHTLKGAAATVGLPVISGLCHQVESALDQTLDAGNLPDATTYSMLFEACDALEGLVRDVPGAGELAGELMVRLSTLTGVAPAKVEPTPALEPAVDVEPATASEPAAGHAVVPTATMPLALRQAPTAAPIVVTQQQGQTLRVSLLQLERLLATNHELIISGSTLEQRLQRLGQMVVDLRHAGNRLREVGGRLEKSRELALLLTGTANWGMVSSVLPQSRQRGESTLLAAVPATATWQATLSHLQNGQPVEGEFDALELDRYTEFHRIVREVAEAALDVNTLDSEIEDMLDDLRLVAKQQGRLHGDQNNVLLKVRMLPMQTLVPRVARAMHAVAGAQGKQVELVTDGEGTLLDRAVMEQVADALLHLVRNAVDHGLETPQEREARGKPAQGTIVLSAKREGPEVVITMADDGRGLDNDKILRAATARGLVADPSRLTEDDIAQLIFAPGMSTAEQVTDISGRGVGLDVVRANIQSARGHVDIASTPGQGTTFTLRVPVSLSLLAVALVQCAGNTYAIPLTLVRHVERMAARRIVETEEGRIVKHGGRSYPVVELSTALDRPATPARSGRRPIVFVRGPQGTVALAVDGLIGKKEVVVKDLGRHLLAVRGLHGATILGNGDLVLILDIPTLLLGDEAPRRFVAPALVIHKQRQLLVVDDSPSVRRLTCAVFEREGWETRQARDGVEAMDLLRDWRPDAVVMDIEMPRMDGFELLGILKRQVETAHVPCVMVTSRSGDKHRDKATRLGVDGYLVKPYQEEELISTVENLLLSATVAAG